MQIPDNVALFIVVISVSLAMVVAYDKLRSNPIITREDHLEAEIKRLDAQIAAQQLTIDMLGGRIWALQKENERLRSELIRQVPNGAWRVTETADVARALERLSADEFRNLVYENFRVVFDRLSDAQSLQAQRLALIDYADKHGQIETLKSAIIAVNAVAFG